MSPRAGEAIMESCFGGCVIPCCNKRVSDYRLGLLQNTAQMACSTEALGINLVDVLGAGWAGREPSTFSHHLYATDRHIVTRRACQNGLNLLASKIRSVNLLRRQFCQNFLLRGCGWRIDTFEKRLAEFMLELMVYFARITAHARSNFRRQERRD